MQTLKNCGVRTVVVSPGSRSTPLTFAAAGTRGLETIPVLDERSAAFFALGLAKSTSRAVALVCTSGTAVANYLPAVVEAKMSRTPLFVISADRPPEAQNCHAGQTIPQIGIFSNFTVFEKNCVPANTPSSFSDAHETACEAFSNAMEKAAPVHVNVQLRDPLSPSVFEKKFSEQNLPADFVFKKFCAVARVPLRDFTARIDACRELVLLRGKKVLIVAGTTATGQDDATEATQLAHALSAPILADATHAARRFPPAKKFLIERYDAICRNAEKPFAENAEALRPDAVLQIGTLPESKALRSWLTTLGDSVPVYIFDNYYGDETDALRRKNVTHLPRLRDAGTENLLAEISPNADASNKKFLEHWKTVDLRFREKSEAYFKNEYVSKSPTEPQIARFLCENVPAPETAIFVANGMPVRDMNAFCPAGTRFWIFHNRGANGIDGTLSTALGVAHACMEQTILYTGDLSLLHDTNGFLLAPHFCGNLTIVLQNNAGGNIFRHLPVAKENPFFEKFWLTPQRADFEKIASAYGLDYIRAKTLIDLKNALKKFRSHSGIHLIEIRTDGETSRKIRAELAR